MITIGNNITKKLNKFWNGCVFHPTDAIEDPWGKKILDRMSKDKAIKTVRIYAMFEDIVYIDENGNIAYDFRLNDLRLDYLVEKGFDLVIAYGMLPKCFVEDENEQSNVSKNKTRYKGKMLYTSSPKDYSLWEDVCREYTKHIVGRYGEKTVAKWHLHCYNEPDLEAFFLKNVPMEEYDVRLEKYFGLYRGFVSGVLSVSDKLCIGGPALAGRTEFLDRFLKKVKAENLRLDYIALHNYAKTGVHNAAKKGFCTDNWFEVHKTYTDVIRANGFYDTEIVYDEWGMAAQGFYNVEECPVYIARETEVFSAYFVKLVHDIIKRNEKISELMICLSGQHEMTTDFSGFRNFFTMNFFAKPIYNANLLAAKLHDSLVESKCDNDNVFVIPTKNENGEYAVLMSYSSPRFEEDLPCIKKELVFDELPKDQRITVYCIDKDHTNPYRLYRKLGLTPDLSVENIRTLRDEGNIKPIAQLSAGEKLELTLSPNSVYLILTEK